MVDILTKHFTRQVLEKHLPAFGIINYTDGVNVGLKVGPGNLSQETQRMITATIPKQKKPWLPVATIGLLASMAKATTAEQVDGGAAAATKVEVFTLDGEASQSPATWALALVLVFVCCLC